MKTRVWIELAGALAIAPAVFVVGSALDLHERLQRVTDQLERWQADEMILALLAACLALAVFAARRWREAEVELGAREIAERALGDLGASHRELAHRLLQLQESERRHLARELHDHLGQTCCVIRVEAACLLEGVASDTDRSGLRRISLAAEEMYAACHDLLSALQPPVLDELGLPAALQALVEAWERTARIECLFYPSGCFAELDPSVALALYRIAQESLSNVLRHAKATRVIVRLERSADGTESVHLVIQDNGVGLRQSDQIGAPRPRGLGLIGMQERAHMFGGSVVFDGPDPCGFRVACRIPFVARSQQGVSRRAAPALVQL